MVIKVRSYTNLSFLGVNVVGDDVWSIQIIHVIWLASMYRVRVWVLARCSVVGWRIGCIWHLILRLSWLQNYQTTSSSCRCLSWRGLSVLFADTDDDYNQQNGPSYSTDNRSHNNPYINWITRIVTPAGAIAAVLGRGTIMIIARAAALVVVPTWVLWSQHRRSIWTVTVRVAAFKLAILIDAVLVIAHSTNSIILYHVWQSDMKCSVTNSNDVIQLRLLIRSIVYIWVDMIICHL